MQYDYDIKAERQESSKIQALYSKDSTLDQHYQSMLPMLRTTITKTEPEESRNCNFGFLS